MTAFLFRSGNLFLPGSHCFATRSATNSAHVHQALVLNLIIRTSCAFRGQGRGGRLLPLSFQAAISAHRLACGTWVSLAPYSPPNHWADSTASKWATRSQNETRQKRASTVLRSIPLYTLLHVYLLRAGNYICIGVTKHYRTITPTGCLRVGNPVLSSSYAQVVFLCNSQQVAHLHCISGRRIYKQLSLGPLAAVGKQPQVESKKCIL